MTNVEDDVVRDARRYRWLRATGCSDDEIARRCSLFEAAYDDELDAAIDRELAADRPVCDHADARARTDGYVSRCACGATVQTNVAASREDAAL
jgi:hypothetical protein